MEYVNTMCNQRCSEMECRGGGGGVCEKVKCFRNKPPSYSLSSGKDGTWEAKMQKVEHCLSGLYNLQPLLSLMREVLLVTSALTFTEDLLSHVSSSRLSLWHRSLTMSLSPSPTPARPRRPLPAEDGLLVPDAEPLSLSSGAQVLIWCPIKSD